MTGNLLLQLACTPATGGTVATHHTHAVAAERMGINRAKRVPNVGRSVRGFGVTPAIGGSFVYGRQCPQRVIETLTRGNAP